MWTRAELKGNAKNVLRSCLWSAVLICLISALLGGEFGGVGSNSHKNKEKNSGYSYVWDQDDFLNGDDSSGWAQRFANGIGGKAVSLLTGGLWLVFKIAGLVVFFLVLLLNFLIGGPILVGSKRFFMCSRHGKTSMGEILYAFRSGSVPNVILTMILVKVKTFLWTLLLVIPGIVKRYEYKMVPYILSENPGMKQDRVFELSKKMMSGQKMDAFILDLSFILWNLLGAVTYGILNILFVNPYVAATSAELYGILREQALTQGQTNAYELPGYEQENYG